MGKKAFPLGDILFVGDPHGRFRRILRVADEAQPEAIVLLGDNSPEEDGLLARLNGIAPTYYILGNHDADGAVDRHILDPKTGRKLQRKGCPYYERHLDELPADRDLHGRVVKMPSGLRVAGFGGVFRGQVWDPHDKGVVLNSREEVDGRYAEDCLTPACATFRQVKGNKPVNDFYRLQPSIPLRHWASIWPEDYLKAMDLEADILVMHEAPESYPRGGYTVLGDLARSMGVHTVIHGHRHAAYRGEIADGITVYGTHKVNQGEYEADRGKPNGRRPERMPLQDFVDESGMSPNGTLEPWNSWDLDPGPEEDGGPVP